MKFKERKIFKIKTFKAFHKPNKTFKLFSETLENFDYSISMKSVGNIRDFYSFGIYGRDFNLDEYTEPDSAGILKISTLLIALSAAIAAYRNIM